MAQSGKKEIELQDFDPTSDQVMDLWYQDSIEFGHGCRLNIKIKNVLFHARSKYQEIAIMETEKLGKMLVVDGITMLTEFDERAYHEMIAHVPLLSHPRPERVLVIGGGDGGVVREILKHPAAQTVHLCEIDEAVVMACREHLPSLAASFDDPKVQVFYEDGAKFVSRCNQAYDIIIVDSTDPLGPGKILFQKEFYTHMKRALTPGGIAITQCESIYLHSQVITGVFSFARDLFAKLGYYYTLVPTYPSGIIGFFFCSLGPDPIQDIDLDRAEALPRLRYYTPEVHRSSFTLPRFAEEFFTP